MTTDHQGPSASGREFIVLMTALMTTTALGIDLMLPAFPDMRAEFGFPSDSTTVTWEIGRASCRERV